MILGIDASNIRAGGGLTHLLEILSSIDIGKTRFQKVVIWASSATLSKIPNQPGLTKRTNRFINTNSLATLFWQFLLFKSEANRIGCNLVFAPGSTFISNFRPFVTLSQNMLPFERSESSRFKKKTTRLRFWVLYLTQSYTFKKASGIIFLTNYARDYISSLVKIDKHKTTIIPHGISASFLNKPKQQKSIGSYNIKNPFRFLYVSIVTVYKHQWNVVKAISKLRKLGYPVELDLVGPRSREGFDLLERVIKHEDPKTRFIHYHGQVNQDKLKGFYHGTDGFVFASSCENMPIILIEAMSAGLPVACSERGPMREVLGENGFYFNPEDLDSIVNALIKLLENPILRFEKATKMFSDIGCYTWEDCSSTTFKYLSQVALIVKENGSKTNQ